MVVMPCSMRTLGAIAHGMGDNLLTRAADVTLKERRPLVVVPRETPFNLAHLRNMAQIAEMGGILLPPIMAFYHRPKSVQDMVDHCVGKVLDVLKIPHSLYARWEGPKKK
jgi:polyprenyl P-hydroxybenzoate/phenylacrylic acid decarboxylase-like protein